MPFALPPLNALKAFEAAARHKSISLAADELGVTQGAVSKQISRLETYLGTPLFQRKPQKIVLTQRGEHYLAPVQSALTTIEQATESIRRAKQRAEILHINLLPSLSTRWLIPLLDDFRHRHPRINVTLSVGDGAVDLDTMQADIAIRSGITHCWKPYHAEILMGEELLPVCAPAVKSGPHPIHSPNDLRHHNLLQHTTRPTMWQDYLRAIGCEDMSIRHHLGFEHFFMLIEAALDGMGVALIPRFLIEKELHEKRLVPVFKASYQSPYRYYLICDKRKADLRPIRQFKAWLMTISKPQ